MKLRTPAGPTTTTVAPGRRKRTGLLVLPSSTRHTGRGNSGSISGRTIAEAAASTANGNRASFPTTSAAVTGPRSSTDMTSRKDRKSDVSGKSESIRVDLGGRRRIKKKTEKE